MVFPRRSRRRRAAYGEPFSVFRECVRGIVHHRSQVEYGFICCRPTESDPIQRNAPPHNRGFSPSEIV